MPHRNGGADSAMRGPILFDRASGAVMISLKEVVDWASVALVIASGGLAGHYASVGMNGVQWAGAIAAVLGSVTVAVAVRVWPSQQKVKAD